MTTIVLVGVASFLVVFAIIVKARGGKPKKPEKWEKAQIVKQLLALSKREDMVKGIPLTPYLVPHHQLHVHIVMAPAAFHGAFN